MKITIIIQNRIKLAAPAETPITVPSADDAATARVEDVNEVEVVETNSLVDADGCYNES